ncbi:RecB family exonuclease [Actinomyces trachealis]|uniref:RecB family exonuclease n=1 Tax=Actinomyces trachealis TaxID=2763540 RepID=UPI0018C7573D|nr:PD-(D/E)XK nuclease family protein [Actinomyces trachealis]
MTQQHPPRPTGPLARPQGGARQTALSPSRAKDFMQCPLLFRLRTVDRLPEPGSLATHKGTLVHAVLERLFDLPAVERCSAAALDLLPGQWEDHQRRHPEVLTLFAEPGQVEPWLAEARQLLEAYFHLENPRRLEPAEREVLVEARTRGGLLLRGFVDRIDVAPSGAVRVVDYKTGKSPSPRFQEEALFQMRFYALVLRLQQGQAPARTQLLYLKDGRTLTHDPRPPELEAVETKVERIWDEVEDCARSGRFLPRRSRLCDWCAFQNRCPEFGGLPPEAPQAGIERLLTARV